MSWLETDNNDTGSRRRRVDWGLAGAGLIVVGIAALALAGGSFRPALATASTSGAGQVGRPPAGGPGAWGGGELPARRGPGLQARGRAALPPRAGLARIGPRRAPHLRALAGRSLLAASSLRHAEAIGLTDEQRERIDTADREARRAHIEHRADRDTAHLEVGELLEQEAELDAVEAKLRQIAGLHVEEHMARLRLRRQIEEILTGEQVDTLRELQRDRFHERREARRPGRSRDVPRPGPGPSSR